MLGWWSQALVWSSWIWVFRGKQKTDCGISSYFFAKWFETDIQDKFEAQLNLFFGNGYLVSYRDSESSDKPKGVQVADVVKRIDFPFGQEFTFDTFLINKKNYFPIASAKEVSKQTGSLFNPFIICGPGGSGKTHLLKSVGNEISKKLIIPQSSWDPWMN